MPVVCIRSAVCLLDRFPALAGADLDVEAGEIVLLSGPNGAGKSTLLRLLAGLLPLRSGTATVLGHDLGRDRRTVRREVSLVGHQTFCYDDLTTIENLHFAARASGRPTRPPNGSGSTGSRRWCTGGCRLVSSAGSRSRWRSRATPSCCSSTSRTRASIPRDARCSTR